MWKKYLLVLVFVLLSCFTINLFSVEALNVEECSSDMDLVCGADNETYFNECLANKAGTTVLWKGVCGCGKADNNYFVNAPSAATLCLTGTASSIVATNSGWIWTCTNGERVVNCNASKTENYCTLVCDDWGECDNGVQSRGCSSYPANCDSSNMLLTRACTKDPFIKVISPNGGEKIIRGNTYTIEWDSYGVDNVMIQLTKKSSNSNWHITYRTPASAKKFDFKFDKIGIGDDYIISIWDSNNIKMIDSSDNYFSISNASSINGICGSVNGQSVSSKPTTNLCSSGNASPVYGNGPWIWLCRGINGGKSSVCRASKQKLECIKEGYSIPVAPQTYQCCSGLTLCPPEAGIVGITGTCNKKCAKAINGVCGSANGRSFSSKPTTNLCSKGTASSVSGTGPWTWSCDGSNGGTSINCSANKTAAVTNGACGAGAKKYSYDETEYPVVAAIVGKGVFCNYGTPVLVSPAASYGTSLPPFPNPGATVIWTCSGLNGGKNVTCKATREAAPAPVDGVCGSANGKSFSSKPATNLCSKGTASDVSGTGPWTWSCDGLNGGTNTNCNALVTISPKCAIYFTPSNANSFEWWPDNALLCDIGSVGWKSETGAYYYWTCTGLGQSVSCKATKIINGPINGECGSANAVATGSKPYIGLCNKGNWQSVLESNQIWKWTCKGLNGGIDASCSAPVIIPKCGSANGGSYENIPSDKLCESGNTGNSSGVTTTATGFMWNCFAGERSVKCAANKIVNGACGSINGQPASSKPATNLCSKGIASSVSGTGPWAWSCTGLNGGETVFCSTTAKGVCTVNNLEACSQEELARLMDELNKKNGFCGSDNGQSFSSKPTTNLCWAGTASTVVGTGPWTWSCAGSNGGTTAFCSANKVDSSGCLDISSVFAGGRASCFNCESKGTPGDWAGDGTCAQYSDEGGYCTRDFEKLVYIDKIVYSGDCTPHTSCRFSLQVSKDGSNWKILSGPVGSGTYSVDVNDTYRYIKEVKTGGNWFSMSLAKVCTSANK